MATFVFLAAMALRLSWVTPEAIECQRRYEANEITMEEYEKGMSSQKSRLVNISWASLIRAIGFSCINTKTHSYLTWRGN